MAVNNINNSGQIVWKRLNDPIKSNTEFTEIKNITEMKNCDKLVLKIPKTETIYRRKELVNDATMGKDCATCYTYVQKTLTFDDGHGGTFDWKGGKA